MPWQQEKYLIKGEERVFFVCLFWGVNEFFDTILLLLDFSNNLTFHLFPPNRIWLIIIQVDRLNFYLQMNCNNLEWHWRSTLFLKSDILHIRLYIWNQIGKEDKLAFEDNNYLKYSKQPTKYFIEYKGLQAHVLLCTKQSNEYFIFTYI